MNVSPCGIKVKGFALGSTLGPNSGPRAGMILADPNAFPMDKLK
jgi:hypothetical protein